MIPEGNPYNNWKGNGITTTFDFDFYIENEKQLAVYHTNSDGGQTLLTYGKDYIINEIGNQKGGNIVFPYVYINENGEEECLSEYGVLQEGEILSLCLTLPISQENPFGKSSYLNLETLEYSLDYLTRICQIISRQMERSVKTLEGSEQTAEELMDTLNEAQLNAAASASEASNSALIASNKANDASDSAQTAINNADISTQKVQEISQLHSDIVTDLESNRKETLSEIESNRESALSEIETIKDSAVENVESEKTLSIEEIRTIAAEELMKIITTGIDGKVSKLGDSMTGSLVMNGMSDGCCQQRFVNGDHGLLFRQDGSDFYMLLTALGDTLGKWNDLRPFTLNLSSGALSTITPVATDSSSRIATTSFVKSVMNTSGAGFSTFKKAANGYIKFSNLVCIQWGSVSVNAVSNATVTFPISFTSTNYKIAATIYSTTATSQKNVSAYNYAASSFNLYNGQGGTCSYNWIAIGY